MIAHDIPELGKIVVLPCPDPTWAGWIEHVGQSWHPVVGEDVDVDTECPTCGGKGWRLYTPVEFLTCSKCGGVEYSRGTGTVTVPHTVTDVRHIISEHEWERKHGVTADVIVVCDDGTVYDHLLRRLDLPGAQPGGVALVVTAGDERGDQ